MIGWSACECCRYKTGAWLMHHNDSDVTDVIIEVSTKVTSESVAHAAGPEVLLLGSAKLSYTISRSTHWCTSAPHESPASK